MVIQSQGVTVAEVMGYEENHVEMVYHGSTQAGRQPPGEGSHGQPPQRQGRSTGRRDRFRKQVRDKTHDSKLTSSFVFLYICYNYLLIL